MTPLFLAAALGIALASPEPPSARAVLKPIGETGSAPGACANLLVHANAAISATLRDDAVLERTVTRLRAADFEGNALVRRNALGEFERVAADVHADAVRGEDELKRLHELSQRTGSKEERSADEAFDEGLQSALDRQLRMAADLSALMGTIEAHDLRSETAASQSHSWVPALTGPASAAKTATPSFYTGSPNEMAVQASVDFESRMGEVANDEARAADHSEAAVSGC